MGVNTTYIGRVDIVPGLNQSEFDPRIVLQLILVAMMIARPSMVTNWFGLRTRLGGLSWPRQCREEAQDDFLRAIAA